MLNNSIPNPSLDSEKHYSKFNSYATALSSYNGNEVRILKLDSEDSKELNRNMMIRIQPIPLKEALEKLKKNYEKLPEEKRRSSEVTDKINRILANRYLRDDKRLSYFEPIINVKAEDHLLLKRLMEKLDLKEDEETSFSKEGLNFFISSHISKRALVLKMTSGDKAEAYFKLYPKADGTVEIIAKGEEKTVFIEKLKIDGIKEEFVPAIMQAMQSGVIDAIDNPLCERLGFTKNEILEGKNGIKIEIRPKSKTLSFTLRKNEKETCFTLIKSDNAVFLKREPEGKTIYQTFFQKLTLENIIKRMTEEFEWGGEALKGEKEERHEKNASDKLFSIMGIRKNSIISYVEGIKIGFFKLDDSKIGIKAESKFGKPGPFFVLSLAKGRIELVDVTTTSIVYQSSLQDFNLDKLKQVVVNNSGIVDSKDIMESTVIRMLGSMEITRKKLLKKTNELNIDPESKVGDYKEEGYRKIYALLDAYKARDKIKLDESMTVRELLTKIKKLKKNGLTDSVGFKAMKLVLDESLLANDALSLEDKSLLEKLIQRNKEQRKIQKKQESLFKSWKKYKSTSEAKDKKHFQRKKAKLTEKILEDVLRHENENVGVLISTGWEEHHVNVECLYENGTFKIVIANAGEGSETNRQVYEAKGRHKTPRLDKKKGITVKIFETKDKEIFRKALSDVLVFEGTTSQKNVETKFDALFSALTLIEDYSIPPRPWQTTSNCVVRNQQESIFYICQRNNRVSLANQLQENLEKNLINRAALVESEYPSLKDGLEKNKKIQIEPLLKGSCTLVLRDHRKDALHYIPLGNGIKMVFGRKGDIPISDYKKSISKRHAVLEEEKGKFLLSLHPKSHSEAKVSIHRNGKKISLRKEGKTKKISLKKGDILYFNPKAQFLMV